VYADLAGIKIINDTSRYIAKAPANTTGFEWQTYVGGGISYNYRHLDNVIVPERGVYFNATASGEKNLQSGSGYNFKYSGVAHFYIPLVSKFSLNIRTGASTVTGNPEFYQYPSIGGPTFRGTVRNRFSGKTVFYNTNDIRYISSWRSWFFSGKAGFLAFVDDGRVWMPDESSNTWHIAYGVGIILVPLNRIYADFTYGRSGNEGSLQVRVTLLLP
jgi:outer membrane protein assembly factor BamA